MGESLCTGVVCFGGQDWWYHNHSHVDLQLMRCYASRVTTLYINSIVMQKPVLKVGNNLVKKIVRKSKSVFAGLKRTEFGFWVHSPCTLPVHHVSALSRLNNGLLKIQIRHSLKKLHIENPIVWVVCPVACRAALQMQKEKLIYLRTDAYEEFPNVDVDVVKKYDQKLKACADLTIFANRSLYEEEHNQCKEAIYLDHGVDYEFFATADSIVSVPLEIADVPKPIVGFFGEISDYTVDIELLDKVIDCLPEKSFVFVGEVVADCSRFSTKKNVFMLGRKPYEQIPHYGKCFDVAIMPWRQNRWIQVCNPIKLKEYLALGKPIVSTPFAELQKYQDLVYQATNPTTFAMCINRAILENNPDLAAKRKDRVRNDSWEQRARAVLPELFELPDSPHARFTIADCLLPIKNRRS
jgi:glycosyltransferase involved in cell wall biosynthesis